jgi:dihydroneopterin aldolase
VTDRIVLHNMVFQGRHGVLEREQREAQPFQVDVELLVDLQPAAAEDDLTRTIDYSQVFEVCRQVVESTSFRLLETLAEALGQELLSDFPVSEVGVRVRKPQVPIDGTLDWAGVEIWRRRSEPDRRSGPDRRRG